jgi:hypothetical protein
MADPHRKGGHPGELGFASGGERIERVDDRIGRAAPTGNSRAIKRRQMRYRSSLIKRLFVVGFFAASQASPTTVRDPRR